MALHEHWVDLDRVPRIKDSPLSHQLKKQSPERLAAIRTANAELGNRMLNLAAEHLAEVGRQLLAQKDDSPCIENDGRAPSHCHVHAE